MLGDVCHQGFHVFSHTAILTDLQTNNFARHIALGKHLFDAEHVYAAIAGSLAGSQAFQFEPEVRSCRKVAHACSLACTARPCVAMGKVSTGRSDSAASLQMDPV